MSKRKTAMMVLVGIAISLGAPNLVLAGNLEPTAPPASTMKTLDEIPPSWSQTLPASERFQLVLNNEAVLDKETGLVWARDANWIATNRPDIDSDGTAGDGRVTWEHANSYCRSYVIIGNRKGWRLPSIDELASLVDPSESYPALPSGYSSFFNNVQSSRYWSSTTYESGTDDAWDVRVNNGNVDGNVKSDFYYVWPVRGGSGPILVPHTPSSP